MIFGTGRRINYVSFQQAIMLLLLPGIFMLLYGCRGDPEKEKIVVLTFDDAVQSHLDFVAPC